MGPAAFASLPNRYAEYVLFRGVTAGIPLAGRRLLDVGAGLGFDSYKFVRTGARVTALEFSPVLAHEGLRHLPEVRWIGGNSGLLPFVEASFDVVVANAALHHVRDIPATMAEMLRVLKPGGWLLTLCDSYRSDQSSEDLELAVFKDDCSVLSGVNEGIPRFSDFLRSLERHRDRLDLHLYTSMVSGARKSSLIGRLSVPHVGTTDYRHLKRWDAEAALASLPASHGTLAIAARLKAPVGGVSRKPGPMLIKPAAFAGGLESQAKGLGRLARHLPSDYVDLPLLGPDHRKFRLLNGWKLPHPGSEARRAYSRARLYLTRRPDHEAVRARLLLLHISSCDRPEVLLSINGEEVGRFPVCRGLWTSLAAPLGRIRESETVAVEIRVETPLGDVEARTFHVRDLSLGTMEPPPRWTPSDLSCFGLEALAQVGILGQQRVRLLLSVDYDSNLEILNRLRELGYRLEVIVERSQRDFYRGEPGIEVVGTYDEEAAGGNQPEVPGDVRLVVAPDLRAAYELGRVLVHDGGHEEAGRFVVLPGGHALKWTDLAASLDGTGRDGRPIQRLRTVLKDRVKTVLRRLG
jgi:SAM-dependent methyltransferase